MNRTLKVQLGKLCQETHLQWDQLLPIALLRLRSSPTKWKGLSPFKVLYGHPSPLIKGTQGDLKEIGDLTLRQWVQACGLTFSKINDWMTGSGRDFLSAYNSHAHLQARGCYLSKGMECPTIKAPLERSFCCYFVYPYCNKSSRLLLGFTTAKSNQPLLRGNACLIWLHHARPPSRMLMSFLSRTILPGRQQETTNDRTTALL
jgi:hypothetical protein